jgi:ribonuclease HI
VKATSTEGLGFTGTGEGIAAQAICLLILPESENVEPEKKRRVSAKKKDVFPGPLPEIEVGSIKDCVARIDGASDGNPGPSGIGIIFETSSGDVIGELAEPIGEKTNNEAEYTAAIRAAQICRKWGVNRILLITDSQLLARQVSGSYKVKNSRILKLCQELMTLLAGFKVWRVDHVPREKNARADHLSKVALKK